MKKLSLALLACMALAMTGCASNVPMGMLYTDQTLPITATTQNVGSKTGEATCTSILGLLATGDCSVQAAAKAGNISKVSTVDTKINSILGIYGTYTTVVTGQ